MTLYARDQLDSLIAEIEKQNVTSVYLLFGERYLCQQAAERISRALIPDGGNVHSIDASREDFSVTLGRISSYSIFAGRQVYRVNDTRLFHSIKNTQSLWKKSLAAYRENNRPLAGSYLRAMLNAAGLDAGDPANDPGSLTPARWKKLFGFARPEDDLDWTQDLLLESKPVSADEKNIPETDPQQVFEEKLTAGLPPQNILLLLTEDVDRRKRLFKILEKDYVVVDLSVESGSSSKARKSQQAVLHRLLEETLDRYGKTMAPEARDLLLERTGFHPVAVVMETEKLALYCGSRKQIRRSDIDTLIGRTRQEALFELTEALGKRNLEAALMTAGRLRDNGVHPLAIIATVRNYLRSLLLFRSLLELPASGYTRNMSAALFQQQCLPRLKSDERWQKELSGHPYALYMQFKTAAAFEASTLKTWMARVLHADFRLKGSFVAPDLVIQHLLIEMLGNVDNPGLKKNHGGLH
jgi:DNA polymerase-3 subunit delta